VAAALSLVADIELELSRLRRGEAADGTPELRTSVMTHVVWAPPRWAEAARETLHALEERHPSRTILLFPEPRRRDCIESTVSMRCFSLAGLSHEVCSEVIELRLCGKRAQAPASIVQPLLISDLPTFCRWRGEPHWRSPEVEQLTGVCDRLVVDSSEWRGLPRDYERLSELFDRIAVSDIAWGRAREWRGRLAELWPAIAEVQELAVTGPKADALLLAGWLRSRLRREIALRHRSARELTRVAVDGEAVPAPRGGALSPSDLLSDELEVFTRDPIYEAAVRAA
jgi:glucose-6-phosphate dehydrogenase assembly protein OpcA